MAAESSPELVQRAMTASDSDVTRLAECFARNDSPRERAAFDWLYRDNPVERTMAEVAVDESGHYGGVYASLPIRARVDGTVRLALQSLDTLTDRDHRGKGLFVRLARSTFSRAGSEGFAFIHGFPNGSSAPGFFGKLGWTNLDPVPFLIRPLRLGYVAERLGWRRVGRLARGIPVPTVPALAGRGWTFDFDVDLAAVERLWSAFARPISVAVERDAKYLKWRLAKPGGDYRSVGVRRGGELVAWAAWCVRSKHGGSVGYLMDLFTQPFDRAAGRLALRHVLRSMAEAGADVALAWNFAHAPNHMEHIMAGFAPLPLRLRPIELHFGARAFDATASAVTSRRAWYLSYFDSDTV